MDNPAPEGITAEFARWRRWRGVSGLWYARRRNTSPPLIVRAEDPEDLPARAAAALAERRP